MAARSVARHALRGLRRADAATARGPARRLASAAVPAGDLSPERWTELRERSTPMGHLAVDPDDVDVVLYHGSCYDGMGAAYAAKRRLGEKDVRYVAVQHRDRPPPVDGKVVAMLDIAFDAPKMRRIMADAKGLVVIDHHVTAEEALRSVPEPTKVFDSAQSGATLAWQYFHPGTPIPDFLLYLEDRDIWNWQLPGSQEFNAAFMGDNRLNFDFYRSVHEGGAERVAQIIAEGGPLHRQAAGYHESMARRHSMRTHRGTGLRMAAVNASYFKSEIGNILAEVPGADMGLVWHYCMRKREVQCSLRASQTSDEDCAAVAELYGGGGHRRAAAFSFEHKTIEAFFNRPPAEVARVPGAPARRRHAAGRRPPAAGAAQTAPPADATK